VARLFNSDQRDVAELGQIGIVVADEGDVAWDGEARLADRGQDSHGGKMAVLGWETGGPPPADGRGYARFWMQISEKTPYETA
jgi:hypothetical protein